MQIEIRKLADIKPYHNNPRVNDPGVDALVKSIREFGFRQPIVVDADGVIVVGHTRYKAAVKMGLEVVPVHVALDLTPEQARAYRIADNQTATLSAWDYALLGGEVSALQELDFDLDLLGFSPDDLAKLLDPDGQEGLCDPDEVPAPPDEATTQPGDLWLLGDHRLLCGDSSKPEDVDRLLDGAVIHLANTDPPYNVKVEPRSNNAIAAGLSTFQGTTHPPGARPCPPSGEVQTDRQEAAGQGSASGQRLRVGRRIRSIARCVVRKHRSRPRSWAGVLYLGRLCELRELSAVFEETRAVFQPGDHLGQAASRAHTQRLHGCPRVVFLWLARRRCAPIFRAG